MRNLKRNVAISGAAAILAAIGLGGAVAAQAADNPSPTVQQPSNGQAVDTSTEANGAEDASDGPNQGPDANPNEPGHQDADESGETEGAEGAEDASDGPNQGPDANPNEPGHQDADESGETE
ncbi:MAG TPA: hypothetical protein VFK52_01300 [Nocardioidaceae bacterium]|nr:hypothetical protein [Nocardioidaceae bacterium]